MKKRSAERPHPIPVRPTAKTRARADLAVLLGYSESGFFNGLAESEEAAAWLERQRKAKAQQIKHALDAPIP